MINLDSILMIPYDQIEKLDESLRLDANGKPWTKDDEQFIDALENTRDLAYYAGIQLDSDGKLTQSLYLTDAPEMAHRWWRADTLAHEGDENPLRAKPNTNPGYELVTRADGTFAMQRA